MIDLTMDQTFRKGMEPDGNALKKAFVDTELLKESLLPTEAEKQYQNVISYGFADDNTLVIDTLTTEVHNTSVRDRYSYLNGGAEISITYSGNAWSGQSAVSGTTPQYHMTVSNSIINTLNISSTSSSYTTPNNRLQIICDDKVERVGAFGVPNLKPTLLEPLHTQAVHISEFSPEYTKVESLHQLLHHFLLLERFHEEQPICEESNELSIRPEFTAVPEKSLRDLAGFVRNRLVDYLKENWFHITMPCFREKYFSPEPEKTPTFRLNSDEIFVNLNELATTTISLTR